MVMASFIITFCRLLLIGLTFRTYYNSLQKAKECNERRKAKLLLRSACQVGLRLFR